MTEETEAEWNETFWEETRTRATEVWLLVLGIALAALWFGFSPLLAIAGAPTYRGDYVESAQGFGAGAGALIIVVITTRRRAPDGVAIVALLLAAVLAILGARSFTQVPTAPIGELARHTIGSAV